MKNEIRLLFALVSNALFEKEICKSDRQSILQSLPEIYLIAKQHDVANIACFALSRAGLLPKDNPAEKKFSKQMMLSVFRYESLQYEIGRIYECFEKAGIAFVPLKGAVIRKRYPEPWMRTSCDIDILVHEAELERAQRTLCESLGYTVKGERDFHDVSLFSEGGVHLELHFNIKENMDNIDRLLEKVWDYTFPVSEDSKEMEMTGEFLIFHCVSHMAYHFVRGGCGIRPFVDLRLLTGGVQYDEEKLREMLSSCGIERFYDSVLLLSKVWFDGQEHNETTLEMEKYIVSGGAYGSTENTVSVEQTKTVSKTAYFIKRIFMPYKQLVVKYPELEKHPYLAPVYQVRRWGRIIFKGGMKRTRDQFEAGKRISSDKVERTKILLEKIGLE